MRHTIRFASGVGLVIVGVIGMLVPIMPQWPFLIPGLIILADYIPAVRRFLDWLIRKFPVLEPWAKRFGHRTGVAK